MPDTLGHLFVQGLATRAVRPRADLKWILLGCVIPDVPWILFRLLRPLTPTIWLYDLRLYGLVQGSLLFSILLAAAFASIAARPGRVFLLLAVNGLLHLLLDACQIHWGNAVHLLAPFSWSPLRFGWFWPESAISVVLTLGGLALGLLAWWRAPGERVGLDLSRRGRTALGLCCLAIYLAAPLLLLGGPERADALSIGTLRDRDHRPGRAFEFERQRYVDHGGAGDLLYTLAREPLAVAAGGIDHSGVVSGRATFLDEDSVEVTDLHVSWPYVRNAGSYVGLSLLAAVWIQALVRARERKGAQRQASG